MPCRMFRASAATAAMALRKICVEAAQTSRKMQLVPVRRAAAVAVAPGALDQGRNMKNKSKSPHSFFGPKRARCIKAFKDKADPCNTAYGHDSVASAEETLR